MTFPFVWGELGTKMHLLRGIQAEHACVSWPAVALTTAGLFIAIIMSNLMADIDNPKKMTIIMAMPRTKRADRSQIKSEILKIPVTGAQKQQIADAAARSGQDTAAWARDVLITASGASESSQPIPRAKAKR
jgi:hypothetical protein